MAVQERMQQNGQQQGNGQGEQNGRRLGRQGLGQPAVLVVPGHGGQACVGSSAGCFPYICTGKGDARTSGGEFRDARGAQGWKFATATTGERVRWRLRGG